MYIVNGIAYAGSPMGEIEVTAVKPLEDMMLLITFATGEKRLYDASLLLDMPAFQPLRDTEIFDHPVIDHGVVTWDDGDIDIAPEKMYQDSYEYEEIIAY